MSPGREWKTEGEIRDLIHAEQAKTIDLLRDGAQASLNTALLLGGSAEFGIKGFMPEVRERLLALEGRANVTESTMKTSMDMDEQRRKVDDSRFETLEAGQYRIRRCIKAVFEFAIKKGEDGKTGWTRIAASAGFLWVAMTWVSNHHPSWTTLKMFVAKLGWMSR